MYFVFFILAVVFLVASVCFTYVVPLWLLYVLLGGEIFFSILCVITALGGKRD